MLDVILPIIQTGAVGCMLLMTWKLMVRRDDEHNKERKEIHQSMQEMIKEVTQALVYKNVTDEKMADAIDKLTEQLRILKEKLQ